jgi:crotonobetainyl-CoA:carnitine CoA-transferase CaiB-like acyl-CoA transferase
VRALAGFGSDTRLLDSIELPRAEDCDATIRKVAPDLGQHNAVLAAGLGFSRAEIAATQSDGALFSA